MNRLASIKISIIVLTYNHEEYVVNALSSIEGQGFYNVEVVIGDDASEDETQRIICDFERDSKLIFHNVFSKVNVGITKNFNACLAKCTGDYIFLLGGDDVFLPGKIERQVQYMQDNPDILISYHDVDVFDSETDETLYNYNKIHGKYEGGAALLIERGTFNCGCSVAVRNNKTLPLCDERIRYASDWLWYIDILMQDGGRIGYFDGVWSRYRRHSNNVTGKSKLYQQYFEVMTSLQIVNDKYPQLWNVTNRAIGERKIAFAVKNFISRCYLISFKLFCEAIATDVLSPISFIKLRLKRVLLGSGDSN